MNLTKEVKDFPKMKTLCPKHYFKMKKGTEGRKKEEIEKDSRSQKKTLCSWNGRINLAKNDSKPH